MARVDRRRDELGRARVAGVRAARADSGRRRPRRCHASLRTTAVPRSPGWASRGDGPIGVGSYRMRHRPVMPLRSISIPASLVSAAREQPGAGQPGAASQSSRRSTGVKAISKLKSWGDRKGRLAGHLARPVPARRWRQRTARLDGGDPPRPRPDPRLPAGKKCPSFVHGASRVVPRRPRRQAASRR